MGIRAAANSIASGIPSNPAQIAATSAAFVSVKPKRRLYRRARCTKSCTASLCEIASRLVRARLDRHLIAPTTNTCSRARASRSREVASTTSSGQSGDQPIDEGCGAQHLFEVVEDQQETAFRKEIAECCLHRLFPRNAELNGVRNRSGYQRRIAHRRAVDEENSIVEPGANHPRNMKCEPGLPDSAGAGQSQQPDIWLPEKLDNPLNQIISSDERRGGQRQERKGRGSWRLGGGRPSRAARSASRSAASSSSASASISSVVRWGLRRAPVSSELIVFSGKPARSASVAWRPQAAFAETAQHLTDVPAARHSFEPAFPSFTAPPHNVGCDEVRSDRPILAPCGDLWG